MRRTAAATVGCGLALAVVVAVLVGAPASDAVQLMGFAAGGALAAGAAGTAALSSLRHRSVRAQAVVVALTSVVAVGLGATAAADAMFLSAHDYGALLVILVTAGTVGLVTALVLGDRLLAGSRSLGEIVRRIGDPGGAPPAPGAPPPATEELAGLAGQLAEMSNRLEQARARERSLEASRRELVAWVSHDLRTPLAGIRAMVEALEDGVVTDAGTVERYHRTMRLEVDRLAGLVDDLFELSRIQAGALELHLEPASLSDLISDALAGASAVADAKGVHLEGRLDGPAPEVEVATPEVLRVLRNLLDNAIRHTPSAGEVCLEAGVMDHHAVVSVRDRCGGIPGGELDRVFDLAFRGDAARTPEHDGRAGLGLAIARGIVEAHHGDIAVRNEEGGCRFTLRLPLPTSSSSATASPA
ncbi:MAG: HAMP domain-containing histidine kinase [Actinomycetota bacterium]|nr:HAMP domain-containing histidine kinase [Actinomycetota bacterium]